MIYFFYGENKFALQRGVDDIVANFTTKYSVDAVTRLDATEISGQNLIAEIVNINMFAPHRLIIAQGFENAKDAWEKIGESLDRVSDETDLVIVATKPDKRTKTYKNLLKTAKTREFSILKPHELKRWLIDEMIAIRVKIDAEAVDELLVITGGEDEQQARLATEITKFKALGKTVTVDLVRRIIEPNLATNTFAILDLAVKGKQPEVAAELKNLQASGEDANKFFGLLASQIFALSAVVFAGSDASVAKDLKIHPFQLQKMSILVRELGDPATAKRRVEKITRALADADAKMKLGGDGWSLLEILLSRI